MEWKLIHNEIVLEDGLTVHKPDAQTIFKVEFKGVSEFNGHQIKKPSEQIKDLKFAKSPCDLELHLYTVEANIFFDIVILDNQIEYSVPHSYLLNDYVVIDNKWIPLLPEKKQNLDNLLLETQIDNLQLTLRQALKLRRASQFYGIVIQENIKNEVLSSQSFEDNPLFNADLYPYQKEGYRWMKFMIEQQCGFVLADEMGLGKSVQVIRLICQRLENANRPFLIVAPASILENWRREFNKFTTGITVHIHQGSDRSGSPNFLSMFDVLITSYETLNSDLSILKMICWDIVIADEAQAIKNPGAQRTQAIKELNRNVSIAVTGTPFENKLIDVWSIVDFISPDYLPNKNDFEEQYANDILGASEVEPLISPIILRRKVQEVAKDLPEKIIVEQAINLDERMIEEYENIRNYAQQNLSLNNMLATFTKLRMFCCDPALLTDSNPLVKNNKLERLVNIIEEIVAQNEKCIIFTSFQKMIDMLRENIRGHFQIYTNTIDGRTPISERQKIIDEFSGEPNSAVLVLNPKAAGTGLNITAANHVIHYNSEWNPAVEDQASARSYRRGQLKPVMIYKLFYAATIEEYIQDRLSTKRQISETAIIGVQGNSLSYNEIFNSLNLTPQN